jgi:SAM-dependent methyltransferase
VAGFRRGEPNAALLEFVEAERPASAVPSALDIGCGAGRNAVPIAARGWRVVGTDLAGAMLAAAAERGRVEGVDARTLWVQAPMEDLPVPDRAFDLVVAHGIWNLARSGAQLRRALAEAARAARPGAGLFVFTFSRNTLSPDAEPVAGEPFVFTQFAGEPQCFLTADELRGELGAAGFDPAGPLVEHNLPRPGQLNRGGPVIFEGGFHRRQSIT